MLSCEIAAQERFRLQPGRRRSEKVGLEKRTQACYLIHPSCSCQCITSRPARLRKCTGRPASRWWRPRVTAAHASWPSKQLWPRNTYRVDGIITVKCQFLYMNVPRTYAETFLGIHSTSSSFYHIDVTLSLIDLSALTINSRINEHCRKTAIDTAISTTV